MEDIAGGNPEPSHSVFPTEIIIYLFKFLSPKTFITCRQVCLLWKKIIDGIDSDGPQWEEFCRQDFPDLYKSAKLKCPHKISWFEIYRSLSIWPRLNKSKKTITKFCKGDELCDDVITDIILQEGGVLQVLKKRNIQYFNVGTLEELLTLRGPFADVVNFIEDKEVILKFGFGLCLLVLRKVRRNLVSNLELTEADRIFFPDVRNFIVHDRILYFASNRSVYSIHIDNGLDPELLVTHAKHYIETLGFSDGCLNILDKSGKIYTYNNNSLTEKLNLMKRNNLNVMNCLYRHNMLKNLNWDFYYQLLEYGKEQILDGPRYITKEYIYGDLFLFGTKMGDVIMYYKPFLNEELNIYKCTPLRSYRLRKQVGWPYSHVSPVVSFRVIETKYGHQILVAMSNKIYSLTFTHEFENFT